MIKIISRYYEMNFNIEILYIFLPGYVVYF